MTDPARDVDAAVALIRGLRFYQDAGPDIPDCVPMRPLLTVQAINRLTLGHLRLLCAALAEARQQLAAQAQETTRERTWCQVVASQLKEAQRQLAAQAQEIAKLKQEASEHLDYMSQASTAVREIQDAQRERDAQVCEAQAPRSLTFPERNEEARACAAAIRAARTPQEPTA